MDKILNIKIYFGVEIILRYCVIFEDLIERGIFDTINVSLDKEVLLRVRNGLPNLEEFYEQYYDIMRWIFKNPNIHVSYDQSFPLTHWNSLIQNHSGSMVYYLNTHLVDELVSHTLNLPQQYITISTKIWGNEINKKYDGNKQKIIDALNTYDGKILIMGERNIAQCSEYITVITRSIYNDLISNLKNYEDYTYEDSSHNNEMNGLKKSFYIMNKSSLNVIMTDSGIRITNLFLNKHALGLTMTPHECSSKYVKHYDESTMHYTNDVTIFVEKLQEFIKRLNNE